MNYPGYFRRSKEVKPEIVPIPTRYFDEKSLKTIMAVLMGVGGLIVLLFCVRHGVLPQTGWESLLASLWAVALTGLFVTVVILFVPMLPAFSCMDGTMSWEERRRAFDIGFLAGATVFFLTLSWSLWGRTSQPGNDTVWTLRLLLVLAIAILVVAGCRVKTSYRDKQDHGDLEKYQRIEHKENKSQSVWCSYPMVGRSLKRLRISNGLEVVQLSFSWIFAFLIGSLIVLNSLPESLGLGLLMFSAWLVLMVVMNYGLAKRHAEMEHFHIALLASLPTLVLFIGGTLLSNLNDAPIRVLGLGLIDAEHILIANKYSGLVEQVVGPLAPNPFGGQNTDKVCIVSRIGGEYLLVAGSCNNYITAIGGTEDRPSLPARIWLPGDAVLSWSREAVTHPAKKTAASQ